MNHCDTPKGSSAVRLRIPDTTQGVLIGVLTMSSQAAEYLERQKSMAYIQYFKGLEFRKTAMQTDAHMHGGTSRHA